MVISDNGSPLDQFDQLYILGKLPVWQSLIW